MSALRIEKRGSGLLLEYRKVRLAFDTGLPDVTTLLSHAHSDHTANLHAADDLVATPETLDTLVARNEATLVQEIAIGWEKGLDLDGVRVTALNAGHVIGSAMFLLEFDDGLRVLYTGDYNVVDSIVHHGAKPTPADVLITEATYGSPEWVFPDRKEVHTMILEAAQTELDRGMIPLFKAYSLGKAQEAIAVLEEHGFEVVSGNRVIDDVSNVYSKHGTRLSYTPLEQVRKAGILERDYAIVSSSVSNTLGSLARILGEEKANDMRNTISAFNLSGWTLRELNNSGFPLSAHSDFPSLMEFTEAVKPRIVYCFAGNARRFCSELAEVGVNAVPLE
jgi:putative mRNA 3-end processing factor